MVRESMTVYEESSGQQYRFVMPGPRMEEEQWQAGVSVLQRHGSRGDYLVASGSLPPGVPDDFYRRLGKVASERGIRLVLDTSGMPLKLAAGHAWMVKPNVRELQQITETELTSDDDIVAAASSLIEGGRTHAVLVSLGAGGAMLVTAGGSERLRTPTVQIRSKVGAGDSMVAGTVVKLAQGVDVRIAARYGIAAGAAAVMTPGTELCRYEDTERLFKQMNGEGEV
jgi:6-phosphofructokinase 2